MNEAALTSQPAPYLALRVVNVADIPLPFRANVEHVSANGKRGMVHVNAGPEFPPFKRVDIWQPIPAAASNLLTLGIVRIELAAYSEFAAFMVEQIALESGPIFPPLEIPILRIIVGPGPNRIANEDGRKFVFVRGESEQLARLTAPLSARRRHP